MKKNLILSTDSYKYSMYKQYEPGTTAVSSYIESRGGRYKKTLFFGLQMFIKEYLMTPITMEDVDEAESFVVPHGLPFNRSGWEYIVNNHGGYLPICIRAPKEGSLIDVSNVLVEIVNTDPECFWLTTFVETALLRAIWYPTTVATGSHEGRTIIKNYLERTSDDPVGQLPFKLHDFGARATTSGESAAIGGLAHLVNFMGTDTIEALRYARTFYNEYMAGYSIPAAEHSTICEWGRDREVDAYRNMLTQFAKPGSVVAVVSDSYDVYNAVENIWGKTLHDGVVNSGAIVVIRPDSGDPLKVPRKLIHMLDAKFGHTVNAKGFRVLKNVRLIQGDGIDNNIIETILGDLTVDGYATDNIAFGCGGNLLQKDINRDTQKFAQKASAAEVNGVWREVYKDPITDAGKRSKRGLFALIEENGTWRTEQTWSADTGFVDWEDDRLERVYRNGELLRNQTLAEIREIAASY